MTTSTHLQSLKANLPAHITLVAVSKTKPKEAIMEAYQTGHRVFGENKVQELAQKHEELPKDIEWHMIGHLQRNKVKYIAPFVSLIHGVDSFKLLKEINKRAAQNKRIIQCLFQIHIAQEESKFGFSFEECTALFSSAEFNELKNISVVGLMGMASNTDNQDQVRQEFRSLCKFYHQLQITHPSFHVLSMGMSGDYPIAIEEGSNMIRVGSAIFGARVYS